MTEDSTPKQEYKTPRLVRYGTLSELTQVGNDAAGGDFNIYKSGSHIPPGRQTPPPGHSGP